jgi:hypothetical protein
MTIKSKLLAMTIKSKLLAMTIPKSFSSRRDAGYISGEQRA